MKQWKYLVILEYITLYTIMVVIYFYLEAENNKVWQFQVSASHFLSASI